MPWIRTGIAALATACLVASPAAADTTADGGWYIAGFVGGSFPDDLSLEDEFDTPGAELEIDSDLYFGGAIGGRFQNRILGAIQPRLEIEASYFESDLAISNDIATDLDIGDVDVLFILVNGYADLVFSDDQPLIPYIGGGAGIAIVGEGIDIDESEEAFAATAAIGLALPIGANLEVYGEGRYFRAFNLGDEDDFEVDVDGLTAQAGIRIVF